MLKTVEQIATLFFPEYKMSFTPRTIILTGKNGVVTIDENNFEPLQEIITQVCCLRSGPGD